VLDLGECCLSLSLGVKFYGLSRSWDMISRIRGTDGSQMAYCGIGFDYWFDGLVPRLEILSAALRAAHDRA